VFQDRPFRAMVVHYQIAKVSVTPRQDI